MGTSLKSTEVFDAQNFVFNWVGDFWLGIRIVPG
jgi:hypothetical protein